MYSYKLESHPDVLLINHLRNVGERCADLVEKKDLNFSYKKETLVHIARVMGYTHDLGKGTTFFQKYLHDMMLNQKSDVDKTLRSHGFLSAIFTYLQLKDYNKKLALIAFVIVRNHHDDLENADIEYNFAKEDIKEYKKNTEKQLSGIYKEEINQIIKELLLKTIEEKDILSAINDIKRESDDILDELQDIEDFEEYILYKFLFSILIFADKEDAIFKDRNEIIYDIPWDLVDRYKEVKFRDKSSDIGDVRNDIYDDVMDSINNTNNRIMSITVPTGTGKTLTSMAAALHLKEKLKKDMKIIYCLPFTSVIDQNYDVYKEIIKTVMGDDKVTNDRLLKHHHLTDIKYIGEERSYEENKGKFLIENWNSQVIVTTFMQFFNTLFSNKNSELIKFNSISNSIILLDEVQSLPYCYWIVINKMFKELSEKLNIYFILITATQPLIFDRSEIVELAKKKEMYFKIFKRTKLHVKIKPITFNEFTFELERLVERNNGKNILIILNTVRKAQRVYKFIKYMNIDETDIYFLSTGIVPKERRKRINQIKESKRRKIVISTQLIEAGVDIDMDVVIRDLATLDSINQSAGRGNREYRGEYLGEVYIYNILADNGREFCIYDKFLISKTKEVLETKDIIYEEDYLDLNNSYFNLVRENMSKNTSRDLIECINQLMFKDTKNKFKLIDEQNKVSVFVETDDKAAKTWDNYQRIKEIKNIFQRRNEFDKIKKDFYDNVINVFKNKVRESEENGFAYIPYDALSGSYDGCTGYILEEGDVVL